MRSDDQVRLEGNELGHNENLFLALLLDPALHETVSRRVRLSVRKHAFTGTPIATERLHLSLLNFGRQQNDEVATKVSVIAATVRFPPFEVTLDRAMSFRRHGKEKQPFVLTGDRGVEGLRTFHRMLHDWFFGDDFGSGKIPSFTPHLTLLYDRKLIAPYPLERPLSWTARDFALVRSHVGKSRYDIVGRWPLIPEKPEK